MVVRLVLGTWDLKLDLFEDEMYLDKEFNVLIEYWNLDEEYNLLIEDWCLDGDHELLGFPIVFYLENLVTGHD